MHKFRKKPVVIEAFQLRAPDDTSTFSMPMWLVDAVLENIIEQSPEGFVIIQTLEGKMIGNVGGWIIRGVKGELYPCKPDIFAATYEAVVK